MLYKEFNVGDKSYKLRLTTKDICGLEEDINMNPLMIFGKNGDWVPTVGVMVAILFHSLQSLNHGINRNEAYSIFDEWLAKENKIVTDFIPVIVDIYKVSGLIKEEKADAEEKN